MNKRKLMQDLMVQEQLLRGTMAYCGLTRAIGIVEAQPEDDWIRIEEDDPATFPPNANLLCCRASDPQVFISQGRYSLKDGLWVDADVFELICAYSGLDHPMVLVADPQNVSKENIKRYKDLAYLNRITAWMPLPKPYRGKDA